MNRYYLQFEARMGMRIYSDVAIDDFSLSPECFGLNIPPEQLQGYNYYDQRILQDKTPHEHFVNQTGMLLSLSQHVAFYCNFNHYKILYGLLLCIAVIELSTCNVRGKEGPTPSDCSDSYNNTEAGNVIQVIEDHMYKGAQVWRVPSENYYT